MKNMTTYERGDRHSHGRAHLLHTLSHSVLQRDSQLPHDTDLESIMETTSSKGSPSEGLENFLVEFGITLFMSKQMNERLQKSA